MAAETLDVVNPTTGNTVTYMATEGDTGITLADADFAFVHAITQLTKAIDRLERAVQQR